MTIKISPITFNGTSKTDELDDSIVLFDEPLQIVGTNERQWNGTIYDLNTTDAAQWDGIITQNHDSKLTDVIGKAIGLFKNKQGIFIRGIKYATEINPVAVLAKNLLTHGFAPGFSCETLGPDPDENGIWHNHVVCGLSQVVHPNDKMAYAIVSNSLEEAEKAGFDTTELRKEMNSVFEPWKESFQKVNNDIEDSIAENKETVSHTSQETTTLFYDKLGRKIKNGVDLSHQVLYNKGIDQINEGINQMTKEENATKIGNSWHDEYGRFTFSPFGSTAYAGQNAGDRDSKGNYVGKDKGNYTVSYSNQDVLTLKTDVSSYGDIHYDGKKDGSAANLSVEEYKKQLDTAIEKFRNEALSRFEKTREQALKESQRRQQEADTNKKNAEKILNLDQKEFSKIANKYESELRKANKKAEDKIKAGKDLRLADFATQTGKFSDDGAQFKVYTLNGVPSVGDDSTSYAGGISKSYYDGDTFLYGNAVTHNAKAYNAYYADSSNVKAKYGGTSVEDYNGVSTSSVDYKDFYNKMVKQVSTYKALEDVLNK